MGVYRCLNADYEHGLMGFLQRLVAQTCFRGSAEVCLSLNPKPYRASDARLGPLLEGPLQGILVGVTSFHGVS